MELSVFSIRDKSLQEFYRPSFDQNDKVAARSFGDLIASPEGLVAKHPEDFCLYYLGTFDTETGFFTQDEEPRPICEATAFKEEEER